MPSEKRETGSRARSARPTRASISSMRRGRRGRAAGGQRAQVCPRRQVRIERWRFDQRADVEQDPPPPAIEFLAEHLDRATVAVHETGQDAHRRRLAGTVGTEEAVHDAGRHGQVEAVEGSALRRSSCAGRAGRGPVAGYRGGHRPPACHTRPMTESSAVSPENIDWMRQLRRSSGWPAICAVHPRMAWAWPCRAAARGRCCSTPARCCGCTRWGCFRSLSRISGVSGGSITAGVLALKWQRLAESAGAADRSAIFTAEVIDPLRMFARQKIDLFGWLRGTFTPGSSPVLQLAAALDRHLYHGAMLADLPRRSTAFRVQRHQPRNGRPVALFEAVHGRLPAGPRP